MGHDVSTSTDADATSGRTSLTLSSSRFWMVLLSVAALGIALRALHLAPMLGSDDEHWIRSARHFAGGEAPDFLPVYFTRAVFLAALAVWGQVTAISVPAATPLMLAVAAITTVLVGLAARTGFGPVAGIVAATLHAVHPLNVAYDPHVLPDGLAVCFEAAFILMVTLYLTTRRHAILVGAGVLAGLMFGTKSYFVLVGLPIGLFLLFEPGSARQWRLRSTVMLVGGLLLGLLVAFGLQVVSSGDPFAEFHANSGYGDRLLSRAGLDGGRTGFGGLALLLLARLRYLVYLYFDNAGPLGWIYLAATIWGCLRATRAPIEGALVSIVAVSLLFLMFMPGSLSPLVFVEMQSRYLTLVLVPVEILSAAWLVRMFIVIRDTRMRSTGVAMLIVALAWCAWIPSMWWDRYYLLQALGIREAARECAAEGVAELRLPNEWNGAYSEELSSELRVSYGDFAQALTRQQTIEWLRLDSRRCVFLPREPARDLSEAIAKESVDPDLEFGTAADMSHALRQAGIEPQGVYAPADTLRMWLKRLGVDIHGQLLGWRYRVHAESR